MQTLKNADYNASIDSVVSNNNKHYPTDIDLWSGNNMTDKIMKIWLKIMERTYHYYSLVGFLLPPNPMITKEAPEQKTDAHEEYVAKLIDKLLLDPYLIGREIS